MSRLRGQLLARALQAHCRPNLGPHSEALAKSGDVVLSGPKTALAKSGDFVSSRPETTLTKPGDLAFLVRVKGEASGVLHNFLRAEHDVRASQSTRGLHESETSIFAAQADPTPSHSGEPTSSSFSLRTSTHESYSSQHRAGGFLQAHVSQASCCLSKDPSVLIRRPSFSPTFNIAGSNITVARSLLREPLTVPSRSFSSAADAPPAPVSSPLLTSLSEAAARPLGSDKAERTVRAKLTGIKQGVLKMNLVATLVRGMTVEDALNQLAVTPKRAAKTVSKVVHAAKSNAVQNHRLDEGRLIVAEAFVGKGLFLKRMNPHGRGKSGVKVRQRSQLTVVVREMSEEEASRRQQAKARGSTWRKKLTALTRKQLVPHKVVHLGQQGALVKEADSAVQQA